MIIATCHVCTYRRITVVAAVNIATTRNCYKTDNLLESSLAVLALITDPSWVADTCPSDTLPRQAVFITRICRGGVCEEHKVEQNIQQQVSVDTPQSAVSALPDPLRSAV